MPESDPEARFNAAIDQWRQKHKLRDDEPVMLLMELFRIHQAHWDALRNQSPPGFEHLRALVSQVSAGVEDLAKQTSQIMKLTESKAPPTISTNWDTWIPFIGVLLAAIGGVILGSAWRP